MAAPARAFLSVQQRTPAQACAPIPFVDRISIGEMTYNLGSLEILNLLGNGKFGDVYLVRFSDDPSRQHFAMKVLQVRDRNGYRSLQGEVTWVMTYLAEKNVGRAGHIVHPYAVFAFDVEKVPTITLPPGTPTPLGAYDVQSVCMRDFTCILMEYVDGTSADVLFHNSRALVSPNEQHVPSAAAGGILLQLTLALFELVSVYEFAHRDVKPANIVINVDGRVVIVDFGGLRSLKGKQFASEFGTRRYFSPEQAAQCEEVTIAVDEWGVMCVMRELLAGRVCRDDAANIAGPMADGAIGLSACELPPWTPPALGSLLSQITDFDVEMRPTREDMLISEFMCDSFRSTIGAIAELGKVAAAEAQRLFNERAERPTRLEDDRFAGFLTKSVASLDDVDWTLVERIVNEDENRPQALSEGETDPPHCPRAICVGAVVDANAGGEQSAARAAGASVVSSGSHIGHSRFLPLRQDGTRRLPYASYRYDQWVRAVFAMLRCRREFDSTTGPGRAVPRVRELLAEADAEARGFVRDWVARVPRDKVVPSNAREPEVLRAQVHGEYFGEYFDVPPPSRGGIDGC